MRFIGSKKALLEEIDVVIRENVRGEKESFCDLFCGTGAVGRYFKPRYRILSNDLLHFSYMLQKATLENNRIPAFPKLRQIGIPDPLAYLEAAPLHPGEGDLEWFILRNYSPWQGCTRQYLSCENAARIDFIRETAELWRGRDFVSDGEYAYLLACLVAGVPNVSNITGTYGAYLKRWDGRAFKPFRMARLTVTDNRRENRCFNRDAGELIDFLKGDILYLDPPYNVRQYAPNYHLLETISRADHPAVSGVTGVRPCKAERSRYCSRRKAAGAFEDLVARAQFTDIVVSYSTDGIMTAAEIEAILKRCGVPKTFRRYDIPYRKYKSKVPSEDCRLREYLFYIQKDLRRSRLTGRPTET